MVNEFPKIRGVQMSVRVKKAVTTNGPVTLVGSAFLIHNVGDETVMLDANKTLPAGDAIPFKTGDDLNVIVWDLTITFAGGGVNPRVEFLEIRPNLPGYNNYKVQ